MSNSSDSILTGAQPKALPWTWFEFRQAGKLVVPALLEKFDGETAEESAQHVWQIAMDGQIIPFKYFRKRSPSGAARPTVMIVHGMGLTIASFRGVSAYFFETHDLVLADYSGFSLSSSLPAHASFLDFASAVWRIADALKIERLSLAGNSLGGGLSLLAALLEQQRVDRILLSNPACYPQALPQMYRLARIPILGELLMALTGPEKFLGGLEYIGYVDKSRFDPALRNVYRASLSNRRTRLRMMQLIRQLPANASDLAAARHLMRLGEVRVPVLITWGMKDPLLAAGSGERLATELPNCEFYPYDDLAHLPHEEAPERIGPRWAAFLNGEGGNSPQPSR